MANVFMALIFGAFFTLLFWRKHVIEFTTMIHVLIVLVLVAMAAAHSDIIETLNLIETNELRKELGTSAFNYVYAAVTRAISPFFIIWFYQGWKVAQLKERVFWAE